MRAVNLIPADQRGGTPVGAGRSGGAAYALLGTFAGLAVMALLYGLAHRQVSNRTSEAATLSARAQQEQAAAEQLAPYTSFVALRQQRAQAVETLVESRFDWAHVMHEFGRVLPAGASIATLSGTIGPEKGTGAAASGSSSGAGATVASATPPGSVPTFSVTGCAVSQAAVAQVINHLRLIDGVSGVTLQSSTRSTSGSSGGGCQGGQPAYAVTVAFQPLPASSGPVTTAVAAGAGSGSASGASAATTTGSPR